MPDTIFKSQEIRRKVHTKPRKGVCIDVVQIPLHEAETTFTKIFICAPPRPLISSVMTFVIKSASQCCGFAFDLNYSNPVGEAWWNIVFYSSSKTPHLEKGIESFIRIFYRPPACTKEINAVERATSLATGTPSSPNIRGKLTKLLCSIVNPVL